MGKKTKKKSRHKRGKAIKKVSSSRGVSALNLTFQQALAHHQAGRLPQAEALYRQILDTEPDHADALHFLGMLAHQVGKSDAALELMTRSVSFKPDCAEFYYNLGIVQNDRNRTNEAEESFRRTVSLKPDYAEAHNNLGVILKDQGRLDEALACFRRALSLKPDYAEAHNNLGNIFQSLDKFDEAAASYHKALSINDTFVDALYNLGIIMQSRGQQSEAITYFLRVIALQPHNAQAYNNIGSILSNQGKLEEALSNFQKALSLNPDLTEAHNNLGIVYAELGKIDDAVTCYRKALSLKPDYVKAFRNLSAVLKSSEPDDVIHTMETLFHEKKSMSDPDRIHLGFALGKVFENLKEYEKSFEFILEANRLKRRSYNYSINSDFDFFEKIKRTFSPGFFAAHHNSGSQNKTPIFILGMLRSGTTLVEQILASHSLVFGAGELEFLRNLAAKICTGKTMQQFPDCIQYLEADDFKKTGINYIENIRKYSKDTEHITDKMPGNFVWVGLIKVILPNAKVVHCVRNPMDTCYSIFKNDFTDTHKYAYDMSELGQYYNLYRELMAYWEEVLPGFMYTVDYEKLISDQQQQTENLLDFCNLPWEKACLDFHKTKRSISTASLIQARQPIYKDSVELWKRYEKQLEPLKKAIHG